MSLPPPSGTVTFLFTDIEGSTQLWEQHPEAMQAALSRHDAILRGYVEGSGGHVVKTTGDGLHAAFAMAPKAAQAVLAGQRALLAEAWGELRSLPVRMALHTGEAEAREGDYYGPAVNRAARLMAIAHGGQILLSATCAELVREQLPDGASLLDLGQHRLKDLSQPENVFQLCAPDLPQEFPPLRSLAAYPTNLPVQLTRLIGREAELAEARQLLQDPACRLLTLTGPGGTGKTRLALQLAAEELDHFEHGAWLVELAPLSEAARVPGAIAAALGVREPPGRPLLEALLDYLRNKHLLLVLDNCEHLVEASAQAAEALLRAAPRLKVLASSREPLGIPGERVFRVPSLKLPAAEGRGPAALEAVRHSEAGQLFVERAAAGQPRFALNAHNSPAVAQIVQRLDGIPLAIELAAARVRVLSPEQIAARLDDRFRLLTGGSRTALPRHQTLLAAIEWSYQLLSEPERVLLRRLSVFTGGWTLEAAESVAADPDESSTGSAGFQLLTSDVLDLLSHLADKSLVVVEAAEAGETRYRMLETIRQFARDKLLEAGEGPPVRERHLRYFLQLAEAAESRIAGPEQAGWLGRMETEHDNLRAALRWALDSQPDEALRLAAALHWFWGRRGHTREGREWLSLALDRVSELPPLPAEDPAGLARARSRGRALTGVALLAVNLGEHDDAAQAGQSAVETLEAAGDDQGQALALGAWGLALIYAGDMPTARSVLQRGEALSRSLNYTLGVTLAISSLTQITIWVDRDYEGARTLIEEELRHGRRTGDDWLVAEAVYGLAWVAYAQADWRAAKRGYAEALQLFDAIGDRNFAAMSRSGLADSTRRLGELEESAALYRTVVATWQEIGHRPGIVRCLECLAFVAGAQGQIERAGRLFGAAEALRENLGAAMMPDEQAEYGEELARLRAQLGDDAATFEAAWQAGRRLSSDEAVDLAAGKEGGS